MKAIRQAIESLNANYGRGTVVAIRLFLSGRGEFDYVIPHSHHTRSAPRTRLFRIKQGAKRITIYAMKHQRTVTP